MPAGTRNQWTSAHELGHVIVMERMGKRTSTDQSASLYLSPPYAYMDLETEQCMGNWVAGDIEDAIANVSGPFNDLFDLNYPDARSDYHGAGVNGSGLKGPLTMEYQSAAAREGWADFFAAWLFNQRTQSDCVLNDLSVHDFDLDGDIDDSYNAPEWENFNQAGDGLMNCEGGGPGAGEPFPLDPVASYVTARDWLGDMTTQGACVAPAGLSNRAVQYDWLRFWWDMTTDEGIPPQDLADIYVDMCPTTWNTASSGPFDGRVRRRLEISAAYHLYTSEYLNQRNNGVNR